MLNLIQKAIRIRKRLNRLGKSHYKSEQFIRNLEYWIGSGASIKNIVQNHEPALRIMMTINFIKQFEKLKEKL